MKIVTLILSVFLIGGNQLSAQVESNDSAVADDLFLNGNFLDALVVYRKLMDTDSLNANLNFKVGVCYLNSRSQKIKAIDYLEKAILFSNELRKDLSDGTSRNVPVTVYKMLGDAYYLADQTDKAIICYEKFKKKSTNGNCVQEDSLEGINKSSNFLYENVVSLLPDNIPSVKNEYTSGRTKKKSSEDENCFEEICVQIKNAPQPKPTERLLKNAKTNSAAKKIINEATIGTSKDGRGVLLFRVDDEGGDLYTSTLNDNQWTISKKLNKIINTGGWEQGECISADGSTLYFTSNRIGGYGGKDIYKSQKLPNGKWGKAINLGPIINTPYDESAPFIYPDGVTLYFSSSGHKKNGESDIFVTTLLNGNKWSEPVGVGFPVNMAEDKMSNSLKESALYLKEKNVNGDDNYTITFFNNNKTPLALVKTRVVDPAGGIPQHLKVTVTDIETGEIESIYHPDNNTGECLFILPSGKKSNITYEAKGYLFQSEYIDLSTKDNYCEINKTVLLPPIDRRSKIILNNVFFDSSKVELLPASNIELNRLFNLLNTKQLISVQIYGCLISGNYTKYNSELVKRRAQAVEKYLVEKGINKENIRVKKCKKLKQKKIKVDNNKDKNFESTAWLELKIVKVN